MIDFQNINCLKHFNVPVELCKVSIQSRRVSLMRLYLLLKWFSSGKIRLTNTDITGIATSLSCSKRTIKNHLQRLIAKNWIGYNANSQIYFIRGFSKVCEIENINPIWGAWFEFSDFETFEAFCAATIFEKLIRLQRRRRSVERKKGRSIHTRPAVFFPVAIRAFAKIVNFSQSKAYRLKKLAKDAGYIDVKKKLICLNVPSNQLNSLLTGFPDAICRIRVIKGKLFLIEPDEVQTFILLKKRKWKKTEQYIRRDIRET